MCLPCPEPAEAHTVQMTVHRARKPDSLRSPTGSTGGPPALPEFGSRLRGSFPPYGHTPYSLAIQNGETAYELHRVQNGPVRQIADL